MANQSLAEYRDVRDPVVLPWPEFQRMFLSAHRQGEHISMVGPTNGGKTTVGIEFCKMVGSRVATDRRPSRVTILVTKPKDDTVAGLGWPVIKKWPPAYGEEHCIIWPARNLPPDKAGQVQRRAFKPVLNQIYVEGGQAVYVPEAADFEAPVADGGLGMRGTMRKYWADARSNKATMIADTQRPRFVTRSMWTEPEWVVILRPDDEDDLKEVARLSGMKIRVLHAVRYLGPHEFLCVRRQRGEHGTRELYVSKVRK